MKRSFRPKTVVQPAEREPGGLAFGLYCLFVISYFLHMGDRVPALGSVRIDMLLCGSALVLAMAGRTKDAGRGTMEKTSKLLLILCGYIVVSLPFVKWPGSVIWNGWEPFVKAILFYLLTVLTVTTENRLKTFLAVFLSVQSFRVLEPLYLNVTQGYWGSMTDMGDFEFMNRLSGAPHDIINPNGLAFVIVVVISWSHHILINGTGRQKLLYVVMLAPMLYALSLTGSRSGMAVLAIFALLVVWRSKRRALALGALAAVAVVLFASMSDLERQRYLSIIDRNAKGAETAQGRIDGMWSDIRVGLQRPVFGHGLGTSLEANANVVGEAMPSHTLYAEVLQELGLVGLVIFVLFIVETCRNARKAMENSAGDQDFVHRAAKSMRDFAILLVIFSFASYGLSEYQWYLLAGLSLVLSKLSKRRAGEVVERAKPPLAPRLARRSQLAN